MTTKSFSLVLSHVSLEFLDFSSILFGRLIGCDETAVPAGGAVYVMVEYELTPVLLPSSVCDDPHVLPIATSGRTDAPLLALVLIGAGLESQ